MAEPRIFGGKPSVLDSGLRRRRKKRMICRRRRRRRRRKRRRRDNKGRERERCVDR